MVDKFRVVRDLPIEVITLTNEKQRCRLLPEDIIHQLRLLLPNGMGPFPAWTVANLEVTRSDPSADLPTSTLMQGQIIGAFEAVLLCMGAIVTEVRPQR